MKLLAAIQAGGRSRRMGTDKAWLELAGQPMIEHVIAAAQPLAQRLSLVISPTTAARERYAALAKKWQAELLIDPYDGRGPLGGIATALRHGGANETTLILACDLPFLTTDFLQLLIAHHSSLATHHHLTIPEDSTGRAQLLCGLFEQACLPHIEKLLASNQLRVDGLCKLVATQNFRWSEYSHLPEAERILMNCNTPDDIAPVLR